MKTEIEKIVALPGKSGIFQILSKGKSGIVVCSLTDNKRFAIPPSQPINSLGEISMFTTGDDVPLREVLMRAKAAFDGKPAPETGGDSKALRAAMKQILPDYDEERVYDSDIKKLLSWYNILQNKDMLEFEEPEVKST